MDQGLKERLIGAAVLVALGVWLIPWVLDGEQEQVELDGSDAALQLPTPEEPLPIRTQTLSLGELQPFADEAAATAAAPPPATSPPGAIEVKPEAPAAEPLIARTEPPPAVAESPLESPRAATATPTPPAVTSAPAPIVAPAAPAPKPAAAKPAATPAATARGDAKDAWVVQLGSFGEEANATRLAQRVNTFGYKPAVSSLRSNGRTMYRVRVGPYATRPQADATASALSAHGVKGQVVAAD